MRSGALTTAAWALEQGRDLHIVPGRLDDPAVAGCLAFLREAGPEAHVVAGVAELIEDLGLLDGGTVGAKEAVHPPTAAAVVAALSPPERAVARALAAGRGSVDELVAATGQPGATVLGVLTALEVRGLAVETFGRYRAGGLLAVTGSGAAAQARIRGAAGGPGAAELPADARERAPPARRDPRGCLVADHSVTLRATRQGAALGPSAPAVPLAAWLRWAAASGKWSHGGEVLRKVGATVLAVPVIVAFYVASLRGRGGAHRLLAALGAAAVVAIVAIASLPPAPSAAVPASVPTPVTAQLLDAVRTGHPVTAPIEVKFDSPMDAASVAGALRVSPDSAINVTWDAAGRQLTIAPMAHWQPDTLYTVTIDTSARSEQGGRLDSPVRAVVLTTRAGTAAIAASASVKGHARTDTKITIHLDDRSRWRPFARRCGPSRPSTESSRPARRPPTTRSPRTCALRPATAYRISLTGLVDADGVPFATTPSITVSTVNAPTVVRSGPSTRARRSTAPRSCPVRFTESMDHASTAKAFTVTAGGKRVAGPPPGPRSPTCWSSARPRRSPTGRRSS